MCNNISSEDIFNQHCALIEKMTKEILSRAFLINPDQKMDEYIVNGAIKQATMEWEFLCYNGFIDNQGLLDSDIEIIEDTKISKDDSIQYSTGLSADIYNEIEKHRDFKYSLSVIGGDKTSCKLSVSHDKPFQVHKTTLVPFKNLLVAEVLSMLKIMPLERDVLNDNIIDIGHLKYDLASENDFEMNFQLDRVFNLTSLSWAYEKDGLIRLVYVINN